MWVRSLREDADKNPQVSKSETWGTSPGMKQQILRSVAARPAERDAKENAAATSTQNDTHHSVLGAEGGC